jgi:hypothetical protein
MVNRDDGFHPYVVCLLGPRGRARSPVSGVGASGANFFALPSSGVKSRVLEDGLDQSPALDGDDAAACGSIVSGSCTNMAYIAEGQALDRA